MSTQWTFPNRLGKRDSGSLGGQKGWKMEALCQNSREWSDGSNVDRIGECSSSAHVYIHEARRE